MPDPLLQVENILYFYPDGTSALRGVSPGHWPREKIGLVRTERVGEEYAPHVLTLNRGEGRICGRRE